MPTTPHPWDRRPDETPKSFEAFRVYLELGPQRSMAKTMEAQGRREKSTLEKWSSKFDWRARAALFDREQARQRDDEFFSVERQERRAKRHAEVAQLNGEALAAPARELLRRLQDPVEGEKLLRDLTAPQLIQAVGVAARAHHRVVLVERLSLGMSTENVGAADGGPLEEAKRRASQMSAQEVADLASRGGFTVLEGGA